MVSCTARPLNYVVCLSWLMVASTACGQPADQQYDPKVVVRRPIRAITNPKITKNVPGVCGDNELVIGVVVGDQARAYPINQLTGPSREIINDTLGGVAIAATW